MTMYALTFLSVSKLGFVILSRIESHSLRFSLNDLHNIHLYLSGDGNVLRLFRAGDESTSTEVLWLLAFLTAKNDEVSTRCVDAFIEEVLAVRCYSRFITVDIIVSYSEPRLAVQEIQVVLLACSAGSSFAIPLIRVLGNLSSGQNLLQVISN